MGGNSNVNNVNVDAVVSRGIGVGTNLSVPGYDNRQINRNSIETGGSASEISESLSETESNDNI